MTNHRLPCLLCVAALGAAVLIATGCSDKKIVTEASLAVVSAAPAAPLPAALPTVVPDAHPTGVTPVSWADIKDDTFDQRAHFISGLKGLESRVDEQIVALTAKRATKTGATDTTNWDSAMKEMEDARTALKSIAEEVDQATQETWAPQKDRAGQAWVRAQAAYDKVKGSTTA
jgi:hypothetical protein